MEEEDEMKEYVVTFVGTCKVYARNEHEAEQKVMKKVWIHTKFNV